MASTTYILEVKGILPLKKNPQSVQKQNWQFMELSLLLNASILHTRYLTTMEILCNNSKMLTTFSPLIVCFKSLILYIYNRRSVATINLTVEWNHIDLLFILRAWKSFIKECNTLSSFCCGRKQLSNKYPTVISTVSIQEKKFQSTRNEWRFLVRTF